VARLAQDAASARQALAVSIEQHRQAIEEERNRGAALARELATARRDVDMLVKASDEAAQLRQVAEASTAELRQALQREREKSAALARDLEKAQRVIDARMTPEPPASSQIDQIKQVPEVAAAEQPAATEAQPAADADRLMARASALLAQGDIGAARMVLERAAETGSAEANFALAETYDPLVLSKWGTHGTRGDATKARDLYAKAGARGIQEATNRLNALQP
jgi:hypothetical protein